jgi:hypothetical protein
MELYQIKFHVSGFASRSFSEGWFQVSGSGSRFGTWNLELETLKP